MKHRTVVRNPPKVRLGWGGYVAGYRRWRNRLKTSTGRVGWRRREGEVDEHGGDEHVDDEHVEAEQVVQHHGGHEVVNVEVVVVGVQEGDRQNQSGEHLGEHCLTMCTAPPEQRGPATSGNVHPPRVCSNNT